MFATFRRFRRHVAVLTALALLASVLVAVPAVAAAPEADYTATFDACDGAPGAEFADVPSAHPNAGDIDCIAYYGVTQGTSATTYSPIMSVTREHMALFLTRLAGLVGISMADDPADPGFMDTGDLGDESQAAIAQLADLGITEGTSSTTYSPADSVTRGQMAQFVARLMNLMEPMADGAIGLGSTTQYGFTPSDVDDNDDDADIGTPFTDLGRATKDEYDAITNLYELGVASGISDTSYAHGANITRAAMAGFMVAVLDHSNARSAGLSIQATPSSGWGGLAPTIVISVRDDSFGPVEDQAVDMFSSTSDNNGLRSDGTCNFSTNPDDVNFGDFVTGDCVWNDNDDSSDVAGNIFLEGDVDEGDTRSFHAWIGEDEDDEFDADEFDAQTASVTAMYEQVAMEISSTINEHADDGYDLPGDLTNEGQKVDLRADSEVTFTAQLIDVNDDPVAREGIEVRVEYRQGSETEGPRDSRSYVNTHEAELETDENGQVSFVVEGPSDDRRSDNQTRADDILFASDGLEDQEDDVYWVEETPVLTTDSLGVPAYLVATEPTISATVYLWDQYGNSHRSNGNQKVMITVDQGATGEDDDLSNVRQVISRGYARWSTKVEVAASTPAQVTYDVRMLARNSNGAPVRTEGADAQVVANIEAWILLGQAEIDDLDVTYNDGRVITLDAKDDEGDFNSDAPIYQAPADDDNNEATPVADDDGIVGPDPILVFARAGTAQAVRNITNDQALDLYDQRATAVTDDTNLDEDNVVDGAVPVVKRAVSTDIGSAVGTLTVTLLLDDDDEFLADFPNEDRTGVTTQDDDINADLVYSYDDDDIFIDSTGTEGVAVSMAKFESLIDEDAATVEVLAYDKDGTSIFRVT